MINSGQLIDVSGHVHAVTSAGRRGAGAIDCANRRQGCMTEGGGANAPITDRVTLMRAQAERMQVHQCEPPF